MKDIISKLHPLERKVIPHLQSNITVTELSKLANLSDIETTRAVQWLANKEILTIETKEKEIIDIAKNGKLYLEKGFPEKRYLEMLDAPISKIIDTMGKEEAGVSTGLLKKKGAIEMKDGHVTITKKGKEFLSTKLPEEILLESLPKEKSSMSKEEKELSDALMKRKEIIVSKVSKTKIITLTKKGAQLVKEDLDIAVIDSLTPKLLQSGDWKGKIFRKYDVEINVPKIRAGKRHPYSSFLDDVREKLVSMGFVEEEGPIIESEFYNFDVLYQPQTHPARQGYDVYRIDKKGNLPDKKIVNAVKDAHEHGGKTGSSGWKYKWNPEIAKRLMARAHDTALSARTLSKGVESPGRYFALVKCYRPDVIDATHGVEFSQLGGYVLGKDLTFRHLLGLLADFVKEMTGAEEVKFFPDYFPFTEPSVQISAKHPVFGWMELAGAGVFRPELSETLGYKEPIIAWGFGIDRLAMLKLGIKDIRELFSHDLEFLRKSKKVEL